MSRALVNVMFAIGLFVSAAAGFWSYRISNEEQSGFGPAMPREARSLLAAITQGDVERVSAILDDRPDLANFVFGSLPALHMAAQCNQPAVIGVLLDHGARLDARGEYNSNALHWACWWGAKEAATRLIVHGSHIEDRENVRGATPLLWAAYGSGGRKGPGGDYEGTVLLLLEHGASADTYSATGVPALSLASEKVAKILIKHGAKTQTHPSTRPSARVPAV